MIHFRDLLHRLPPFTAPSLIRIQETRSQLPPSRVVGRAKRHTETNASGFYQLADLRDGVWEVKVEATGYKKTQTTIEIRGERRYKHNLELTPKKSSLEVIKS